MMALFKTEFDIGTLMKAGIISNHYMSHQNRRYAIMKSFRAKGFNLMMQFIGTQYVPHLEPLSLIADYYGEKQALYLAFLMHHIGWLSIPSMLGLIMFGY
jgi:hypothetical protein